MLRRRRRGRLCAHRIILRTRVNVNIGRARQLDRTLLLATIEVDAATAQQDDHDAGRDEDGQHGQILLCVLRGFESKQMNQSNREQIVRPEIKQFNIRFLKKHRCRECDDSDKIDDVHTYDQIHEKITMERGSMCAKINFVNWSTLKWGAGRRWRHGRTRG